MIRKMLPLAAVITLLGACDTTDPRVPTAIQVDQQTVNVQVGETVTVEAFLVDQRGRAYDIPPAGFEITWSSDDPNVATVQNGDITGVGSGQTTVRAAAGTLPPAEIHVEVEGSLDIVGGTFDLPILTGEEDDDEVVTARMAFTYSGHRTGTFAVENTFAVGDMSANDSYGYSFANDEFNDQDFIAWQRRDDGLIDYIEFYVDGLVTETGAATVYLGFFLIGYDVVEDTEEQFYRLEADPGMMNITTATDTRLAGTFTLTMDAEDRPAPPVAADGAALDRDRPRQLRPRVPLR
jgi:hypothetical protein